MELRSWLNRADAQVAQDILTLFIDKKLSLLPNDFDIEQLNYLNDEIL